MANTSSIVPLTEREIFYFRQRYKNRVYQTVLAYFAARAEETGLNRRSLACRLTKDPAQITRWFSGPSNWTLDTISDLLLAMNAEMDNEILTLDEPKESTTAKTSPTWFVRTASRTNGRTLRIAAS